MWIIPVHSAHRHQHRRAAGNVGTRISLPSLLVFLFPFVVDSALYDASTLILCPSNYPLVVYHRPLNSHGLTVRLTVLGLFRGLFSRSHGKVLISHCHSFNLTVTHGFSLPSCLFFLWALIYKILSAS